MRIHADHRFLIEVLRAPAGDLLLQEPVEGLDRLAAEARYEVTSQGLVPDEPEQLSVRMLPLVQAPGQPSLGGLRLELAHDGRPGESFNVDFPKEIVGTRGTELAAQLVVAGTLQDGDLYRVRLVSAPRPPAAAGDTSRRAGPGEPEAEVFEAPFPVRQQTLSDWGISPAAIAAADRHRPVFVARSVLERAIAEAIGHGHKETGTLLLGCLVADDALRASGCETSWAVVVTEQVPVDDGQATAASFTFPPEAFRSARVLAGLRNRAETVVGSQHSHGWNCPACAGRREIRNLFFSSEDERMTLHFPAYGVFLVTGGDPEQSREHPVVNLYVRLRGTSHAITYGTF
jgi:hypothetical protein